MTDKLEAKAIELVDQLSAKLATLAAQYGPEVVDAGLAVARLAAAKMLIPGAIAVIVCIAACRYACALWARGKQAGESLDGEHVPCRLFAAIASGAVSAIAALIATVHLQNPFAWAGIFDPKLYIAARILGLT